MEPFSAQQFEELLLAEVDAGRVSMARIDDAVSRILAAKFELGLFEHPLATNGQHRPGGQPGASCDRPAGGGGVTGAAEERRRRVAAAADANIYVAGRNADNIGNQAGGWTIAWQGISGDIIPGTTILEGIKEVAPQAEVTYSADASAPMTGADVGVVVVGETPYAEGFGDVGGPECGFCSPEQLRGEVAVPPAR